MYITEEFRHVHCILMLAGSFEYTDPGRNASLQSADVARIHCIDKFLIEQEILIEKQAVLILLISVCSRLSSDRSKIGARDVFAS